MTAAEAHVVCLGLVAADLAARAYRIKWIIRGLGHQLTFRDAFVLNAFGDAACALTPLRIAGEPARLAGLLRSRVPASASFVGISLETLAAWPVVIAFALWLAWRYAPAWWVSAGPQLAGALWSAWPVALAVALVSIVAIRYVRRIAPPATHQLRRPIRRVLVYWRRMPRGALAASVPLSLVNVVSRVAVLPVLVLALPSPPALGPVAVGSFALLYSQLVLPTPSGVGAVELGFLAGAAGDLGGSGGWLLVAWRFYTSGVGVVLGVMLAVHLYGWPTLRRGMRWLRVG